MKPSSVDIAFNSGANHVAIYPFIDFSFTDSKVKTMPKNAKKELLDKITNYFIEKGYHRSSIWTFSVEEYCKRIDADELPTSLTIRFSRRQRMVYYLFWTLYSMQLSEKDFEHFFGVPLRKMYGFELWLGRKLGFLTKENGIYKMTMKGAFYYHYYEQFYTLSYIDKMWGVMRKEAFPEEIRF